MDRQPPASLLRRVMHGGRVRREPEPADLGTAFGLDATYADQAAEAAERAEPAPRPRPAAGWLNRLRGARG